MLQDLGAMTAVFTVYADAYTPFEDDVRAVFTARGFEPDRIRARSVGGTAVLVIEQKGSSDSVAFEMVDEIRSLAPVRNAELECHVGRVSLAQPTASCQ